MVKPIIHMGGSGKKSLMAQYAKAVDALHDAEEALCEAFPHGRDYCLVPGSYEIARADAERSLAEVRYIKRHFEELYELAEGSK